MYLYLQNLTEHEPIVVEGLGFIAPVLLGTSSFAWTLHSPIGRMNLQYVLSLGPMELML